MLFYFHSFFRRNICILFSQRICVFVWMLTKTLPCFVQGLLVVFNLPFVSNKEIKSAKQLILRGLWGWGTFQEFLVNNGFYPSVVLAIVCKFPLLGEVYTYSACGAYWRELNECPQVFAFVKKLETNTRETKKKKKKKETNTNKNVSIVLFSQSLVFFLI